MSERIAILGLGLMGGSLAMALSEKGLSRSVVLWARRAETRRRAAELGLQCDVCESLKDAVSDANLVVVCVPVCSTPSLIEEIAPHLKHGAVVTDVGSTKQWVVDECLQLVPEGVEFVGSHPIAGSHRAGLDAAHSRLYENSVTIVTPDTQSDKSAIELVCALWQAVGSKVLKLTPAEHDSLLARSSHLPHIAAAALTNAVCRSDAPGISPYCGSGFYDSTRIAAGSEFLWSDIIKTNKTAVVDELDVLIAQLQQVRQTISQGEWIRLLEWLASARAARNCINRVDPEGVNENNC